MMTIEMYRFRNEDVQVLFDMNNFKYCKHFL